MYGTSRRNFLKMLAGTLAAPASMIGAANAEMLATISAILSILSAVSALSSSTNGMGARLQAMQLQLSAILDLQQATLAAIVELNQNIEAIRRELPELFKEDALRRTFGSITAAYDGCRSLGRQIQATPAGTLGSADFNRFLGCFDEVQRSVSVLNTNSQEKLTGRSGIAAATFAAASCKLAVEALFILKAIEKTFPNAPNIRPSSWHPDIAFADLSTPLWRSTIPHFARSNAELMQEQVKLANKCREYFDDLPFGSELNMLLRPYPRSNAPIDAMCLIPKNTYRIANVSSDRPGKYCDEPRPLDPYCRRLHVIDLKRFTLRLGLKQTGHNLPFYIENLETSVTNGWYVKPDSRKWLLPNGNYAQGEMNAPKRIDECRVMQRFAQFDDVVVPELKDKLTQYSESILYEMAARDLLIALRNVKDAAGLFDPRG